MASDHDRESGSLAGASEEDDRATYRLSSEPIGQDPLSEVLRAVRLSGAMFFWVDATSPWIAPAPDAATLAPILLPHAQQIVSYHVVVEGRCFGRLLDGPPMRLDAGDVLLIPHGDAYVLSNDPALDADPYARESIEFFRRMARGDLPWVVREGGREPDRTRLICGFLGCDVLPFNPALASLPRAVRISPPPAGEPDRLRPLIEFAVAESREARSGSHCVVLRLSELMFVEVVRRCLSSHPAEARGWLAALRDAEVGRALALLHASPAQAWTLASLARSAGTSRSTLAERFAHLVGQPPMQYLARWRMQLAARLLADGAAKVGAVALDVGYDSEAAFSRAFKKIVGVSPASWRARPGAGHSSEERHRQSFSRA